ncbi:hypothetical protein A2U01_0112541, partial [Trifolium medium]|nr:hypothetical protein [Trifolium medium]
MAIPGKDGASTATTG